MSKKVCGIDLGTGNSCVAVIENGKPVVIVNSEGNRTTPSIVYIDGNERKVGESAKRGMITKPKNTVSFIKRFMGANYSDGDVQKMLNQITYDVINKNNKPFVKINDNEYSPEQISSLILSEMKKVAEDYYGEQVTDAVITVPAWFNDVQRNATKTAGELAGLNVLRIINEPTAAILSSNIDISKGDKVIAVVDVGCGTTDISICEVSDGMVEVLASYGDVFLGGQNYDNAIVNWIIDGFKHDKGYDLKQDQFAYTRIVEAAEKAKIELSFTNSTEINLPYICMIDNVPQMLVMTLTKAKFEQLTSEYTEKIVNCVSEALKKANKTYLDINEILLVGGSCRIPAIQNALSNFNVTINKGANLDEAVALGAAKQADVLVGNTEDSILLLDVTPISLGIETMGNMMTKIIDANTTIPTSKKQIFTTAVDNQPAVSIVVLQGERALSKDNKIIGQFNLDGIMPAKKGVPQIEVTFDIDANGILSVSAKDLGTNKEQHITIQNQSLSDEEIQKIKDDAAKFKAEDDKKVEEAKLINECDALVNQVDNFINDENIKLSDEDKQSLIDLKNKLSEKLKDKNIDELKNSKDELQNKLYSITSEMYKDKNPNASQQFTGDNPFTNGFGDMFTKK